MIKIFAALLTVISLIAAPAAMAENMKRKICVFDIAGNAGPIMGMMKDWKTAALGWGLNAELIPYTNEQIAAEDLKAGVCDASLITGIRARNFNGFTGTIDSIGSIPSMDHMRVVLQVMASPKMAPKMQANTYEIMGIAPMGPAHIFVNDKNINSLAKAAGKKVAVLEYDETQAEMVSQVGATPVNSDVTNFSTKFNNGVVDVVVAPLAAYSALELYKGMNPDGGVIDLPMAQVSVQLVAKNDRFPDDIAQKSREQFYQNLGKITNLIDQEAQAVSDKWWVTIPSADKQEYEVMMAEARKQLMEQGYYHPDMLTLLSKVRCKLSPSRAECSN